MVSPDWNGRNKNQEQKQSNAEALPPKGVLVEECVKVVVFRIIAHDASMLTEVGGGVFFLFLFRFSS